MDKLLGLAECKEKGISNYWRKNISHLESSELANALGSLAKMAGYLGKNVGRIEWAGMSQNCNNNIVLDPGMVLGKYPIPPRKFDYLAGLVIHEALHKTEWTDLVWKGLETAINQLKVMEKIAFHKLVYTGEDIYVDQISNQTVFGEYTAISRGVAYKEGRQILKVPASFDNLMYLWWQRALGKPIELLGALDQKAMVLLDKTAQRLYKVGLLKIGSSRRCEERIQIYLAVWEKLRKIVAGYRLVDKTLLWYSDSHKETNNLKLTGKSQKVKSLRSDIARDIETRLAVNSSDITPIIRSIVGENDEELIPTSRWDFNIISHPVIDPKLVSRLKAVFQQYGERKIVINRGLTAGRVDKRKLYRAPVSGQCFFEKQKIPSLDWNICLLVDASGSMSGPRWRMVENTVGILHKAFNGFQNRLQAFAYFEVEGVCMISSLIKGKTLLSVPPAGQTASGQAIIAAAHYMPKDVRRRFLIHITDGESNLGCDVHYGIEYCKAEKIHLATIGVAYKDKKAMKKQYGRMIQFLDHFGQLPLVTEKILKWAMIYDAGQGKELCLNIKKIKIQEQ
ncbi:MAG TPA: VWA domain-containing protein [Desulfobacteraceae bacterium]|nr:VWA domain-containing protein [Desulfobacteraceae bacterium]